MERKKSPFKSKRYHLKWTKQNQMRLGWVIDILDELDEYKPLTIRQIFYQLVGKGLIENTISCYQIVINLLKPARIEGLIPCDCIEDKTRAKYDLTGWPDTDSFIAATAKHFLTGYERDLLQTQDVFIEIWIEKNALASIVIKVAKQYNVSVSVTQNNSTSNLFEYKDRLEYHTHQKPIILFFSDFDPQGDNMLDAAHETLEYEMKIKGIQYEQIALRYGDQEKYHLYGDPDGIKSGDKLAPRFRAKYGQQVIPVELDALPPDTLQTIVREAIESKIDISLYQDEIAKQDEDFIILKEMRDYIIPIMKLKQTK